MHMWVKLRNMMLVLMLLLLRRHPIWKYGNLIICFVTWLRTRIRRVEEEGNSGCSRL